MIDEKMPRGSQRWRFSFDCQGEVRMNGGFMFEVTQWGRPLDDTENGGVKLGELKLRVRDPQLIGKLIEEAGALIPRELQKILTLIARAQVQQGPKIARPTPAESHVILHK